MQITLFLCGDVMVGRGVDQILPHPVDPVLCEPHVRDARTYVELAESVSGPIERPVDPAWPWGAALGVLDDVRPHARIVNLETSITHGSECEPGKGVHYRMSPDNIAALSMAAPDVCALANNHVLDFGPEGLLETLATLDASGLHGVGAGRDAAAARQPRVIDAGPGGRVLVFAVGTVSSGIPAHWEAGSREPGVGLLALTADGIADVAGRVHELKRPGDVVVVSIHWGSNWGYDVPEVQRTCAHQLIDEAGVDIVHGHSSHHPRPIEIYRDKLILYGCGDFIDDYEGITGGEQYRSDLRLGYLATVSAHTGELTRLHLVLFRARRMRLEPAPRVDAGWLAATLTSISERFGVRVTAASADLLEAAPHVR